MRAADVVAAALFVAIFAVRQGWQTDRGRRRDRSGVALDGPGDLVLVAVPRNVLIAAATLLLLRGVPHDGLFAGGWALFLAGVGMRLEALGQLGGMYSLFTEIRPRHRLVTHGLYAVVRHPLYAADIVGAAGIVLFCREPVLALLLVPVVAAWVRRIRREEAALAAALGPRYLAYVREVPALDLVGGTSGCSAAGSRREAIIRRSHPGRGSSRDRRGGLDVDPNGDAPRVALPARGHRRRVHRGKRRGTAVAR